MYVTVAPLGIVTPLPSVMDVIALHSHVPPTGNVLLVRLTSSPEQSGHVEKLRSFPYPVPTLFWRMLLHDRRFQVSDPSELVNKAASICYLCVAITGGRIC